MKEEFLAYAWAYRLYDGQKLCTTDGEIIQIIDPGRLNRNSGPDFENAKIKIGDAIWAGQVEIHVNASDWYAHGHETDAAYQNVILHVVFKADAKIYIGAQEIPTLELAQFLKPGLYDQFESWLKSKTWIPCQNQIQSVDSLIWTSWKDRLMAERLEVKSEPVLALLSQLNGDWKMVFYHLLTENFGFKVNKTAMSIFASQIPWKTVLRKHEDPLLIEALFFGQAGWLETENIDEYHSQLSEAYTWIKKKHDLSPLPKSIWQTGKSRPGNFPCIRIAQLSALLGHHRDLQKNLSKPCSLEKATDLLTVKAGAYWEEHYDFGKKGKKNHAILGASSLQNLLINTLPTYWYAHASYHGNEAQIADIIEFLSRCKAEENQITRHWSVLGCSADNALDSQSMIHLYNEYCSHKRCLHCQIGLHLMKQR